MSILGMRMVILGLAVLASSCDRHHPPPPPDPPPIAFPPCSEPGPGDFCPTGSCGANAPTINGFPINGLRPNGECNKEGIQLVPGSLAGGDGTCTGATLDYEDNKLVGRRSDGSVKCRDQALVGTTFEVRSWVPKTSSDPTKLSVRIRIDDVSPHVQGNAETRIGYALREASAPPSGATLCDADASTRLRRDLGLNPTPGLSSPSSETDVVIPISSELYDFNGSAIPLSNRWRDRSLIWLNLACAGDALAKRSLYQLTTDSTERSRANLRMLTANYCGDRPLTMRGMLVGWSNGAPERREARWASGRATCLDKPRVIYRDASEPQNVPEYLPPELKNLCNRQPCESLADWIAAAHRCGLEPNAFTLPPCSDAEVTSPGLPPVESYIVLPSQAAQL